MRQHLSNHKDRLGIAYQISRVARDIEYANNAECKTDEQQRAAMRATTHRIKAPTSLRDAAWAFSHCSQPQRRILKGALI
ncbi:hypothetical protein ACVIGB_008408 [Bradyrhizobium sp. USDA 4341]